MIKSLFIINKDREVLFEKHWKSITPKSSLDFICEGETKSRPEWYPSGAVKWLRCELTDLKKVSPIVECQNNVFLINVNKNGVFFIAACNEEVPPLFVVEFLNQVIFIIEEYFGALSETTIFDNVVCIFELLDEMLDNGFPLATESNILKELIRPPKLLRSLQEAVTGRHTGVTSILPANQLTNTRWRRAGVKYTNNEAFFDITEKVNAIIDRSGNVLMAEAEGVIDCMVHLSGTPDLMMSFNNSRMLDEISLHPCVRYWCWEKQRILSFIPPDGRFCLFTYLVSNLNAVALPITLRHSIIIKNVGSKIELSVSPKTTGGNALEGVKVMLTLPVEVSNVNVTASVGKSNFDPVSKLFVWDIGRVEPRVYPSLRGSISLQSGCSQVSTVPVISLEFSIPSSTVTGLRVTRLEMHTENYKPYKGVKYLTKSGAYEVRA